MGRKEVLLRMDEELHELAAKAALSDGVPLSQWIRHAIVLRLEEQGSPSSMDVSAALAVVGDVASKLRAGFVLVPASEAGDGGWNDLLNGGGPS